MKQLSWRWILCAAILAPAGAGLLAADQPAVATPAASALPADKSVREGITLPYKKYEINFATMGVIKDVKVKEGDVIKPKDLLLQQDSTEEEAELAILEFDATNQLPIDAAKANEALKQVEFEAKDRLKNAAHGNDLEWAKAKAELQIAKIQVQQAQTELEQKKLKRDKQKTRVENMKLVSKVEGVVQKVVNDLGANVDPTKPSIIVVQNNPLLVEVHVPALASLELKNGDKMRVSFDKKLWKEATVSYREPEANAGSGTRMIHLELPNPEGHPSGMQAYVELPERLLAAGDR